MSMLGTRSRMLGATLAFVALGGVLADAGTVRACASCGCGDPTLTTMGSELPFAGRLRLSLSLRGRTDRIGRPGRDLTTVEEAALHVGVAWSVLDWLTFALDVPLVWRLLGYPNGGGDRFVAIGDSELRTRVTVFRDRALAPSHIVSLDVGAKVPTGMVRDAPGSWAQPGTGSFDPLVGVAYAHFASPWQLFGSLAFYWPLEGRDGRVDGRSVRASVRLQRQLGPAFAFSIGIDGRVDEVTHEHGVREAHSGGAIGFAASELSWSPIEDLLLSAQVLVPVANALLGAHVEGPALWLGTVYDL